MKITFNLQRHEFQIIRHLFLTDLRRLRVLLIFTLGLFAWDFLAFLVADAWSFPTIQGHDSGSSGLLIMKPIMMGGVLALVWREQWAGTVLPMLRAGRCEGGGLLRQDCIPVPHALASANDHDPYGVTASGIPSREAALGTLAAAGVFVPLWTMAAALGRLAGSGKYFCLALVVLALGGILGMLFEPKLEASIITLGDPWGAFAGPHSWYFLGSSAAGLLVLVFAISSRWKLPARLAAATMVVVTLGYSFRETRIGFTSAMSLRLRLRFRARRWMQSQPCRQSLASMPRKT